MTHIVNSRIIRVLPLMALLTLLFALPIAAQEVIRVTGKIVSKEQKMPLYGVNITDVPTGRKMATSDEDGRFAIDVRSNTTLRFSMIGAKTTVVKVKNQNYLEVELAEEEMFLNEVVVASKRITDKVMPEPTDIEIKGNYAYIRTRVRVPREMFSHDTRLVMQPVINNATQKQLTLMRPLVYDAHEYNRTQDRLYNFRMEDKAPVATLWLNTSLSRRTLRVRKDVRTTSSAIPTLSTLTTCAMSSLATSIWLSRTIAAFSIATRPSSLEAQSIHSAG